MCASTKEIQLLHGLGSTTVVAIRYHYFMYTNITIFVTEKKKIRRKKRKKENFPTIAESVAIKAYLFLNRNINSRSNK